MMPVLHDGYIIVVDMSQTNRLKLYGHIIVAAQKEQGLIVSRLQRFDGTEVLMPENREYDSFPLSTLYVALAHRGKDFVLDRAGKLEVTLCRSPAPAAAFSNRFLTVLPSCTNDCAPALGPWRRW